MIKLPRLEFDDGTLEALKWCALILMTLDHVNKYLFNGFLPGCFEAGRLAMPLFVFVLAYNLARPESLERKVHFRAMRRLLLFGTLSSPVFFALGGLRYGWWPLNIMFTLLVITGSVWLLEQDGFAWFLAAGIFFLIGGSLVEFWWPAIGLGIIFWWYCKEPSWPAAIAALIVCTTLQKINGNFWALASLPLILIASHFKIPVPRLRWAFYTYYPLHLGTLLIIRIPIAKAGYILF